MPKKLKLILWCLTVSLITIAGTDSRADSRYGLTPVNGQTISRSGSMEAPVIVYDDSGRFISVVEPATSAAGNDQYKPDNRWRTQSQVDVPSPGLTEAVLIPSLHQVPAAKDSQADNQLDLCLLGPDGRPRGFELFWREKGRQETVDLDQAKAELTDDNRLVWEGRLPQNFIVSGLIVDIADEDYVGQVSVAAMGDDAKWLFLVKDAALYSNGQTKQAGITIKEGVYNRLRLSFKGYDKQYGATPLFVRRVQAVGMQSGRDYETASFQPEFEQIIEDRATVVRVTLPGSGLWITELKITTDALFQGEWQVGRETNVLGKRAFSAVSSGRISHVGENEPTLIINVDRRWPDRVLAVRMAAGDYFGRVRSVAIQARIPRMVFFADSAGRYTVRSGCGNGRRIFDMAGDRDRKIDHQVVFTDIKRNPRGIHDDPAQEYNINGGPFLQAGYTWAAPLSGITKPGFYELRLNQKASLEDNRQGLRLVRDNQQVPYFLGELQQRKVDLSAEKEYDRDRNETTWLFRLPRASVHWRKLRLTAEGVFSRSLVFEIRKPGNTGWQPWQRVEWTNRQAGETSLETSLSGFPKGQMEIRLVMRHGDNKPIEIKKVEAGYTTQDMFFIAGQGGGYRLVGGNPEASAPSYDLALIRDHILTKEPVKISMDEIEMLKPPGWSSTISHTFSEQGWGLYAVLGLVTLILLIIIGRLFPKTDGTKDGADN
jgi:hypothetical protein